MLPTQRALWELQSAPSDPAALNLAFGLLLDGPFDCAAMEWTLQELVRRHEPLRTVYSGPVDRPVMEVVPDTTLTLPCEDVPVTSGRSRFALRRKGTCARMVAIKNVVAGQICSGSGTR